MRMKSVLTSLAGGTALAVLGVSPALATSAPALSVTTSADTVDAAPGDGTCADAYGECSLRAAIQEANADPDATTIRLQAGTYTLTMANAGGDEDAAATGDLDVTSPIELRAFGAVLDADGIDRAVEVLPGASLHVRGLTVTGGVVNGGDDPVVGSGGAFANAGTLRLDGVELRGNRAEGPAASGGAVLNTGDLTITRSLLADNWATRAGGAIEANEGTTRIDRSTLKGNRTGDMPGNGGALHLTGAGEVEVTGTIVADNVATAEGGGLWNSDTGTMTVSRVRFTGNEGQGDDADQGGGALFNDGGTLKVMWSTFTGNVADGESGSGGAILNDEGDLTVMRSLLQGNSASRAGGAIEANVGTTTLDRVALKDNRTGDNPGNGGGLHLTGAGTVDISRSTVTGNAAAAEGGGLWNSATGTMVVSATRVTGNTAPVGPNVYNDGGSFVLNGTPVPPTES